MSELEYLEGKVKEEIEEILKLKKRESNRRMAEEQFDIYSAYVDAGFSEEQAWELFTLVVKAAANIL